MSNQNQIAVSGTPDEWQVLVNLLDVANKACGLKAANACLVWAERITKAANDANTQPPKQVEVPPAANNTPAPHNG